VDATEQALFGTALGRTTTQNCGDIPGRDIPNNTYGYGRLDILAAVEAGSSIVLTKTVGLDPMMCAETNSLEVQPSTEVTYCYTVENRGEVTFTLHSLVDDQLGQLLTNEPYTLTPNSTFSFFSAISTTVSISETTVNMGTWNATNEMQESGRASNSAIVTVISPSPTPSMTPASTATHTPTAKATATPTPTPTNTVQIDEDGGTFTSEDGDIDLVFPSGAVTDTVTITYTEQTTPSQETGNYFFAGISFRIEASDSNGNPVTTFNKPFTLTIHYDPSQLPAGLDEDSLNLAYWDEEGQQWIQMLPCQGCHLDTEADILTIMLNHLTEFALLGEEESTSTQMMIFLPVITN
jgi:hypothetical protein